MISKSFSLVVLSFAVICVLQSSHVFASELNVENRTASTLSSVGEIWAYPLRNAISTEADLKAAIDSLSDTVAVADQLNFGRQCHAQSIKETYTPHEVENDPDAYGVVLVKIESDCAEATQAILNKLESNPLFIFKLVDVPNPALTGSN